MDWWKRLFNEPGTLAAMISSAVVGIVVGVATGTIQKKHGGWSAFFVSLFGGIAVGVMVGLATQDYVKSEPLRLAIVAACAAISDDILGGLKAIGSLFRNDPLGAVARIFDALRGRGAPPPSPPDAPVPRDP